MLVLNTGGSGEVVITNEHSCFANSPWAGFDWKVWGHEINRARRDEILRACSSRRSGIQETDFSAVGRRVQEETIEGWSGIGTPEGALDCTPENIRLLQQTNARFMAALAEAFESEFEARSVVREGQAKN